MNVLKWAENILESVDQTARNQVQQAATDKPAPAQAQEPKAVLEKKLREELQKMEFATTPEQEKDDEQMDKQVQTAVMHSKEVLATVSAVEQKEANTNETDRISKENQTLKSNMAILHDEIKELSALTQSLSDKYKKSQQQVKKYETYAVESRERLENQVSRLLQEKMSVDSDFTQAIEQREKQQKQLESKLQDMVNQLKSKDALLVEIQADKERALTDQARTIKQRDTEIQAWKKKYEEKEQHIADEREQVKLQKQQLEQKETELQKEKTELEEEVSRLQDTCNQKQEELVSLTSNLKVKETEWQGKYKEFQDYKNKAARILQEKDKVIQQLSTKTDNTAITDATATEQSDLMQGAEITDEFASLDKKDLIAEVENLRSENQDHTASIELLKRQLEAEITSSRLKIRNMEKTLEKERANVAKLQQGSNSLKMSLDQSRQRFEQEKKELQDAVKQKAQELKQTQQQLEQLSHQQEDKNAVDSRKVMAEHLIEKQSQMETLNSEKAALKLQLEKAQQRVKEMELVARMTPSNSHRSSKYAQEEEPTSLTFFVCIVIICLGSNSEDEEVPTSVPRVQSQKFFHSLNRRGYLAQKLASGLHLMDRFSMSTARYLRLPLLRLVFVFYIILLHAWVLFVLFFTSHVNNIDAKDSNHPIEKLH